MVRLIRVVAVLALLASVPAGVRARGTGPVPGPAGGGATTGDPAVEVRHLLEEARSAFLDAEFEKAASAADELLARLDRASAGLPDAEVDRVRARALDILAQSRFNLGDEKGMNDAIRRLLAVDPGWQVDVEVAGPKYARLFEARRTALVGFLVLECLPLPCETVAIDGRERPVGDDGRLPLASGRHHVIAGRHGFAPADLGDVEVPAGKEVRLEARLRQVARDVVVVTSPPGADVSLDGTAVGKTVPGGEGSSDESAPLVVRDVPPGTHLLVVAAPCRRRVEQSLEVVLDEQDPGPLRLPPVRLEEAWGILDVAWDGPEGVLAVDGSPTPPGQVRVCPGDHEVSLAVAGRRVFVARVAVRDGETVPVRPRPRPTLATPPGGAGPFPALRGEGWNHVELAAEVVTEARRLLAGALGEGEVPAWPRIVRRLAPDAAAPLLAAAPEADLVALPLPVEDPVRRLERLVLVDPRRGIVEAVAWPARDGDAPSAIDEALAWSPPSRDPWFGIDLADRAAGPPLIAQVAPGSPAASAGLAAGELLLAVGDRETGSMADAEAALAAVVPGRVARLHVRGAEDRTVEVSPLPVVHVEHPAALAGRILLPALARAGVTRLAGTPEERVPAAVNEGVLLAVAGSALAAARELDRVVVDAAMDPEGDARGTILFVLEGLLRRLDRETYAEEIAARRAEMPRARLGGRRGPPLALAGRD